MFSASACNGSNNGSGAWRRKQYGSAEKEKNLTIHFMMPSNWGWTTPAIQFWGGIATVTGNTNTESVDGTEIPGWDGAKAFFMTQAGDTTEYTLSVKGTFTGFQFLDFDNTRNNINL